MTTNSAIKINLSKIPGAARITLTGQSGKQKRGIFIPEEDAHLYDGEKGLYLNLVAIRPKEEKYNQSHFIKLNLDRATYDAMSQEERDELPIIGSVTRLESTARAHAEAPSSIQIGNEAFTPEGDGDLPF